MDFLKAVKNWGKLRIKVFGSWKVWDIITFYYPWLNWFFFWGIFLKLNFSRKSEGFFLKKQTNYHKIKEGQIFLRKYLLLNFSWKNVSSFWKNWKMSVWIFDFSQEKKIFLANFIKNINIFDNISRLKSQLFSLLKFSARI